MLSCSIFSPARRGFPASRSARNTHAAVMAADVRRGGRSHPKLLAAPELVARTWATAKREGDDAITEREVTALLAEFATVWNELFPAEQARLVQLLVERGEVRENAHWRCGSGPRGSRA